MRLKTFTGLMLAATLSCTTAIYAQAKQDMKDAGHETKEAAKDTGHGIKTGTEKGYDASKHETKKTYHKTKHVTKKAYHKTATGTENVGRRMNGEEPVPNHPH